MIFASPAVVPSGFTCSGDEKTNGRKQWYGDKVVRVKKRTRGVLLASPSWRRDSRRRRNAVGTSTEDRRTRLSDWRRGLDFALTPAKPSRRTGDSYPKFLSQRWHHNCGVQDSQLLA
ncbi:uncharacterized protein LOC123274510 [Cotesia glomerata]|uniref:uncharacterized protein LOC123274510 n=1 Tax=Cotesia glomerata TaxID=32391 RepID=UPI001D025566|nr:uncharacterized protein LOC123274510 [Cotesia glomerata]